MAKQKREADPNAAPKCPVTREEFRAKAPAALKVTIDGKEAVALKKEFDTGSLGWFLTEKVTVIIGDVPVRVQAGLNLTLVGSKELPR